MTEDREADVQRKRILNPVPHQVGPYRFTPRGSGYSPHPERIMNSTTFPDVAELAERIAGLEAQVSESGRLLRVHWEDITGLRDRLAIIVSDISDQRDTLNTLSQRVDVHAAGLFPLAARDADLDELRVAEDLLGLIHAEIQHADIPHGERHNLYAIPGLVEAWEILVKNATP